MTLAKFSCSEASEHATLKLMLRASVVCSLRTALKARPISLTVHSDNMLVSTLMLRVYFTRGTEVELCLVPCFPLCLQM